jgi:hypothetical protein
MPVHKHLFVEANPIPVKWAMARMGLCGGTMRLPMTPLASVQRSRGRRRAARQRLLRLSPDFQGTHVNHIADSGCWACPWRWRLLRAGRRQDRLQERQPRLRRWKCRPT